MNIKNFLNIYPLITLWWLFWLCIAYLSPTEVPVPSKEIIYIILLFFLLGSIGYLLIKINKKSRKLKYPYIKTTSIHINLSKKQLNLIKIITSIVFLFHLFFLIKFLIIFNDINTQNYRLQVLGGEDAVSVLYGNHTMTVLAFRLFKPINLLCITYWFFYNFYYSLEKKWLLISISSVLFVSISTLGITPLYELTVLILFTIFIRPRSIFCTVRFNPLNILSFLCIILSIIIIFTIYRFNLSLLEAFKKIFTHFIINYHTYGFSLLSYEYSDARSEIHSLSYGLSSILPLDWIVALSQKATGNTDYIRYGTRVGNWLQEMRVLGITDSGEAHITNAYATMFFTLIKDFGVIGVAIFGFFFGIIGALIELQLTLLSRISLSILLWRFTYFYIGFFSLFQSRLGSYEVWYIIMFILLTKLTVSPKPKVQIPYT